MQNIERSLIWLGHLCIVTTLVSLFFQDEIANPYVGLGIFLSGICSYTLGLALSIYLDKTLIARKANNTDVQSIGSVLKPALLACLCTIITISIIVMAISEYAKQLGVL